jgi:hypothetical protein
MVAAPEGDAAVPGVGAQDSPPNDGSTRLWGSCALPGTSEAECQEPMHPPVLDPLAKSAIKDKEKHWRGRHLKCGSYEGEPEPRVAAVALAMRWAAVCVWGGEWGRRKAKDKSRDEERRRGWGRKHPRGESRAHRERILWTVGPARPSTPRVSATFANDSPGGEPVAARETGDAGVASPQIVGEPVYIGAHSGGNGGNGCDRRGEGGWGCGGEGGWGGERQGNGRH